MVYKFNKKTIRQVQSSINEIREPDKTFTPWFYSPRSFATKTTPPWSLMQRTCRHQSFPTPLTTLTFSGILGSLYNDDGGGDGYGYGYENVTYKVNSRCLKLDRTYSISLNSSNVGKVFCSWIPTDCIKVQENKKKGVVFCSRPRQNVKLGSFTS